MSPIKLLSIDPSSKLTGYAVLDERANLLEAGLLRPRKTKDDIWDRIEAMCDGLMTLITEVNPTHCIIEVPTGRHARLPAMASGSLVKYGCAVGVMWAVAYLEVPHTYAVPTTWTGGKPKKIRAQSVALRFPNYSTEHDKGLDMADAIGMGVWWLGSMAGQYAKRMVAKHKKGK